MRVCRRLIFFLQIYLLKIFFQEYHQSVNQVGPWTVGPDLDSNYLQTISAEVKVDPIKSPCLFTCIKYVQ